MKHTRVLAVLGAAITAAMFMFCGDNVVHVPSGDGGSTPGTTPGDGGGNIPAGNFYTIIKSAKGYEVTSAGLKKAAAPKEKINDILSVIAVDAGGKPAISIQFGKDGGVLNIGNEKAELGSEWIGPKTIVLTGTLQGGGAGNIPLDISKRGTGVIIKVAGFKALTTGGSPAEVMTENGPLFVDDLAEQGGTTDPPDNSTLAECDVVNSPDGEVIGDCAEPKLGKTTATAAKPRFAYKDPSVTKVVDSLGRYAKVNVLKIELTLGSAGNPLDIGPRIIDIDTLNWKYPVTILGSVEGSGTSVINIAADIPAGKVELKNIDVTNTSANGNAVTTASPIKLTAADLTAEGGAALNITPDVTSTVAITGGSLTVTSGIAILNNGTADVTTAPLINSDGTTSNVTINVTTGSAVGGSGADNIESDGISAPNLPLTLSGGVITRAEAWPWGSYISIDDLTALGAQPATNNGDTDGDGYDNYTTTTNFYALASVRRLAGTAFPSPQDVIDRAAGPAEVPAPANVDWARGSTFVLGVVVDGYFGGEPLYVYLTAKDGSKISPVIEIPLLNHPRTPLTVTLSNTRRTSPTSAELTISSTLRGHTVYQITAKNGTPTPLSLNSSDRTVSGDWAYPEGGGFGVDVPGGVTPFVGTVRIPQALADADVDVHVHVISGSDYLGNFFTNTPAQKATINALAPDAAPYVSVDFVNRDTKTTAHVNFTSTRAGVGYYAIAGSTPPDFEIDASGGFLTAGDGEWTRFNGVVTGLNEDVVFGGLDEAATGKFVYVHVVAQNTGAYVRSESAGKKELPDFAVVKPEITFSKWVLTAADKVDVTYSSDEYVAYTWYHVSNTGLDPTLNLDALGDERGATATVGGVQWTNADVSTTNGKFTVGSIDVSAPDTFVHVVAVHSTGGVSNIVTTNLAGETYTEPPTWTTGPALTARFGTDAATISFNSNTAGAVWYKVLASGTAAPDVADFAELKDASNNAVTTNGSTANSDVRVPLPPTNAAYDVYIIVKTTASNSSDPTELVTSTVASGKIAIAETPTYPDIKAEYDDDSGNEALTITVDEDGSTAGQIYYIVKDGTNTAKPASVEALLTIASTTSVLPLASSEAVLSGARNSGDVIWIVIKTTVGGAGYYSEIITLGTGGVNFDI